MDVDDLVRLKGIVTVRLFDEDNILVDEVVAPNIVTVNGLSVLAQALMWSGVQDQSANLGMNTPLTLTPLYGAVGSGTTAATNTDVSLNSELGRTTVSGGGSLTADSTQGAQAVWSFYFGVGASTWSINEAGVFANASASSGTLVNHVILPQTVTKRANASIQLQVNLVINT